MNRNKMSNCTNIYHNHTVNIIACVPCNNNNNNCTRIYNLQAQFCIYSCIITNQDNASTIDTFNTTTARLIPSSTTTTTVQYNLSSLGTTTTTTIETSFPSTEAATTTVSLSVPTTKIVQQTTTSVPLNNIINITNNNITTLQYNISSTEGDHDTKSTLRSSLNVMPSNDNWQMNSPENIIFAIILLFILGLFLRCICKKYHSRRTLQRLRRAVLPDQEEENNGASCNVNEVRVDIIKNEEIAKENVIIEQCLNDIINNIISSNKSKRSVPPPPMTFEALQLLRKQKHNHLFHRSRKQRKQQSKANQGIDALIIRNIINELIDKVILKAEQTTIETTSPPPPPNLALLRLRKHKFIRNKKKKRLLPNNHTDLNQLVLRNMRKTYISASNTRNVNTIERDNNHKENLTKVLTIKEIFQDSINKNKYVKKSSMDKKDF